MDFHAVFIFHDFLLIALKMSIKTGLFFVMTFCCMITLISGIIDHFFVMEKLKKWEQIRTN